MHTYILFCFFSCIVQAGICLAAFANGTAYYANLTLQTSSTSPSSNIMSASAVELLTQPLLSTPPSLFMETSSNSVVTQSTTSSPASISSNRTSDPGSTSTSRGDNGVPATALAPHSHSSLSSVGVGAYILNGLGLSLNQTTQSEISTRTSDASSRMSGPEHIGISGSTPSLSFSTIGHNDNSSSGMMTPGTWTSMTRGPSSSLPVYMSNATSRLQNGVNGSSTISSMMTQQANANTTRGAITLTPNSTSAVSMYLPKPSGNASLYPENANASHWEACQASLVAWSNAFQPKVLTSTVTRIQSNHSLTFHATYGHANVYTTINGYPRAHGTLTPTSVTRYVTRYLQTSVSTYTYTSTRNVSSVSPSPTCTIATAQCSSMWQSYLGGLGLPTNIRNATEPMITPMPSNRPRCAVGAAQATCGDPPPGGKCQLQAGFGQVFYWPPIGANGGNGTIGNMTATPYASMSGPITAYFWKATMTFPSIYLYLDMLSTRRSTASGKHCITNTVLGAAATVTITSERGGSDRGFTMFETLLELHPTGLSSLLGDLGPGVNTASAIDAIAHGGRDYEKWMQRLMTNTVLWNNSTTASYRMESMNYQQLSVPPAKAYYLRPDGAPGCNVRGPHPECSTIFNGAYVPRLAVPTEVRAFDPSFADCDIPLFGSFAAPQPMTLGGQYGQGVKKAPEQVLTSASSVDAPCTSTCRGCCRPGGGDSPLAPQALTSPLTLDSVSFPSPDGTSLRVQTHNNAPTDDPAPASITSSTSFADDSSTDATTQSVEASPAAIIMSFLTSGNAQGLVGAVAGATATDDASPATATVQAPQTPASSPNAISVLSAALQTQGGASQATQDEDAGPATSEYQTASAAPAAQASPAGRFVGDTTIGIVQAVQTDQNSGGVALQVSLAALTIAGAAYTASVGSNADIAVVGGSTLTVGGLAQTLGGQAISAAPGVVVVNGQPISYSVAAMPVSNVQSAFITIDGQIITAAQIGSASTIQVGSSILSVGGPPATIAGQTLSLGAGGLVLQGSGQAPSTVAFSPSLVASRQLGVPVTLSSKIVTAAQVGPGTFALGSITLSAGGPAATIAGQIISAAASALIVGGQTLAAQEMERPQSGVVLSPGSQVITAAEVRPGVFSVGTALLSAGAPAIPAAGETISAITSGLVVDARTQLASALPTPTASGIRLSIGALDATAAEITPGVFTIGTNTISAGGSAVTISGQTISAASSGIVVGGQTIAASALPTQSAGSGIILPTSLGLPRAIEISQGVFTLGSMTLSAGSPAVTVSGHTISAAFPGLVVDGTTYTQSSSAALATGIVFTEALNLATAKEIASGIFVLGTVSLTAGGAAETIDGYTISAGGSGIPIDGTSYAASAWSPSATGVVFTDGVGLGTATEISSGIFLVGTATVTAGGAAKTISGHTISALPSGLVLDGSSYAASAFLPTAIGDVITKGSSLATATEILPGTFVLGGTLTLSAGGPATVISEQTISAASNALVINSHTLTASALPLSTAPTSGVILTETFQQATATELRPGVFAIGSLTLTAGETAATIAGETISAFEGGLVVDGQTVAATLLSTPEPAIPPATTTRAVLHPAAASAGWTQGVASSTQKAKKSSAPRTERVGSVVMWIMASVVLMVGFLGR